ncbi:hypothetical protein RZS08_14925, partial [Arthrospira platensis SPKY1]|nr:hypothetical protein [Arthrospira platensis SPKY1]
MAVEVLEQARCREETRKPDVEPGLHLVCWCAGAKMRAPGAQQRLHREPGHRRHDRERQMSPDPEHTLAHERAGVGLAAAGKQAAEDDEMRAAWAFHWRGLRKRLRLGHSGPRQQ